MKEKLGQWFESLAVKNSPDEFDAKQLVKLYSIKIPEGIRVCPEKKPDIDKIASPYVLKVCSSDILHKTELNGVVLNLDRENVMENLLAMQKRFKNENILVEHQTSFIGPEFIIGVIKDPALGHAVMIGAGGTLTEIYKDTAFRLAPCTEDDALDMIDDLALSPVFDDFRGMVLDKKKLAKTISQVSRLAHDLGDQLSQLDINPVVFSSGQWTALDVKVMLA